MTLTVGSLFSGIGGFDLAVENAGMEILWQCEIDKYAQAVLKHHWPDVKLYGDVRDVGNESSAVDIVVGGFPCQNASRAGDRTGLAGDRSSLWFEYARVLGEIRPQWCIIENVVGLLSVNEGRDFATIIRGLDELGYSVSWRVLDSRHHGVPQRRRRVFLVGYLGDWQRPAEVLFERKGRSGNHAQAGRKEKQAASYPGDTSSWWDGGQVSQTLDAVLYKKQTLPEKNRFPAVLVPAWTVCPDCDDFWCNIHGEHAADCPCPSVDEWEEEGLSPYEPSALRFITPLEAERLQAFPDGWTDIGQSDTQRYKQIGNAVTVSVVEWIARRIVEVQNGSGA